MVSRSPSDKPSSKPNADTAESVHLSPSLKCGGIEGLCKNVCLGDVHPWMFALAVRACRRRLLEMSGWREDHAGTKEGAAKRCPYTWIWTRLTLEKLHIYFLASRL